VRGLTVRLINPGPQPLVRVSAGLAINRLGQALALAQDTDVALTADLPTPATAATGLFAPCTPPGTVPVGSNAGVYILLMAPASRYSNERAPLHGFADNGRINGCGTRDTIEGAQFRLAFVDVQDAAKVGTAMAAVLPGLLGTTDAAGLSRLRNLLAHVCLGSIDAPDITTDLFSYLGTNAQTPVYGVIGRLRAAGDLTDCDVPLALIYWTGSGVQFLDMWSVRRRLIQPDLTPWPHAGEQRLAEGEAAFLQFQEQTAYITRPSVTRAQLVQIEARNHFHHLPAAGVIPFTTGISNRGFDYLKFFNGLTIRDPVFIEGMKVPSLFRLSYTYPAIDLAQKELIWLYMVRENREVSGTPQPQPYLIFTSGYIPYQDDAQYDLYRWQYSNYGPGLVAFRRNPE
jgi:hypothetical protein